MVKMIKYTHALTKSVPECFVVVLVVKFSLLSSCHLGMFGTGILSYFSFLRFLVMLNLIIFLLMFSFVLLPIIIAPYASGNATYNQNDGEKTLVC